MSDRNDQAVTACTDDKARSLLVVDDQRFFRTLVCGYLQGTPLLVRAAKSAEEALDMIGHELPDIVITDVSMPGGMSGLEFCRRLKSDPATMEIPVVILSTASDREDRIKGFEAGADDFFSKSVDREEFMVRVRSLLQLQQTRRELATARLAIEVQHREQIRHAFERYVAPNLVERILNSPSYRESARLDRNTRHHVTVLFADLRGFTRMAEQLEPNQVVLLLNQYFTLLTECAHAEEGTIFNMAGDSLLVGFGAPVEQDDAALRGLRTGQRMINEFTRLAEDWRRRYGIETGLGIGLNEGVAVAGNVGSPAYMSYTLIGDTVNTAARITQRARAGELLFSEHVMHSLRREGAGGEAIELPPIALKGKSAPTKLFCFPAAIRVDINDN